MLEIISQKIVLWSFIAIIYRLWGDQCVIVLLVFLHSAQEVEVEGASDGLVEFIVTLVRVKHDLQP